MVTTENHCNKRAAKAEELSGEDNPEDEDDFGLRPISLAMLCADPVRCMNHGLSLVAG